MIPKTSTHEALRVFSECCTLFACSGASDLCSVKKVEKLCRSAGDLKVECLDYPGDLEDKVCNLSVEQSVC